MMRRYSALLVGVALVTMAGSAWASDWARFAIVVGYNESDDSDLAPLKYADDEAIATIFYW